MGKLAAEFFKFEVSLWPLWLIQIAYVLRERIRVARVVTNGLKALYLKQQAPDSVVRDWLIMMYILATFAGCFMAAVSVIGE